MKVLTIVSVGLLLLGIFSCSVQSDDTPPTTTETTVSSSASTEPTTTLGSTEPTTTSSSTEPTTTSGSNSTGTEPTTTSGSNSTGTEPTTSSGSNSTGTESSTSPPPTTSAAPTTTQSPLTTTPKPEIVPGKWNVSGDDGKICILLDLAATFNITYNSTTGGVTSTKFALVTVPINATETGSCNGSEYIFLQFKNTEGGADFSFNTSFSKDSSTYDVASMTFSFTYDNETFFNPTDPGLVATLTATVPDFMKSINSKNSITCADNREIKFSGLDGDVTLHIDDIKVQAYMTTTSRTYGEGKNCVAKKTSKVVPIAVGCALAALVVIVLIAYLIGRRRSRQQGYQSV